MTWLLDRNVDEGRGAKLAFTDTVSELSYGDLQTQSRRLANLLRRLGVRREERVAMIMLDTVDFPIVFLGAIRAGIVPVPLNTLLTSEQYAYVLADCRARVLFVSEALLPVVKDMVGRMPDLEHVVVAGNDAHGHKKLSDEIAKRERFIRDRRDPCRRAGVLAVFVGLDRHAQGRAASAFQSRRDRGDLRQTGARHSRGRCRAVGGKTVFRLWPRQCADVSDVGRRDHRAQFRAADAGGDVRADEQISIRRIFFGVPTLFSAMLNDETLKNERGGSRLRICTSAGEALPESVGNSWKARFGVDILDGVGSTELLHIFLSNAPGDIKYGSSGKPVPGYRVRLVNEAGSDVPDGEVGELLVDAPSAGEGYWNQRSKSRQTFEGHWTRTGDKYIRDAEGRYTFCGRSDDMFKVSGIWVSPFEVESALITHPAVLEAAVVPEADPEGLLKPKAFVVLRADAKTDGLHDALKEHVKQKIGPWKYPRWIDVVDSLPKTATGKIQRFKLRDGA